MSENFSYAIAQKYLNDSVLMHQLCECASAALRDRVYQRLYKNLKIQKERISNSSTGK